MEEKFIELKERLGVVNDLNETAALLGWDQQTYMPPGGAHSRSMHLSTINRLAHEHFVSDEIGILLQDLESASAEMDPDSDDARLLRRVRREYDKQRKVPSQWVAEFSKVTSLAHQAWEKAREESDFPEFQPHLENVLELRQQYAEFFKPFDHIYDPLLDDFEPGMKTADVITVFDDLRPQQVEFVHAITEHPHQVDDSILCQDFDLEKQWEFGVEVIKDFGFDFNRGRQDKSAHPFTTSFGLGDVRITTRLRPDFFNTALFGTLHEAGHAIYEQGISTKLVRTPLATGTSLAVHESQSRMWENMIGRSRPFWVAYYPRLKDYFPTQFGEVPLDAFYRAINKVERSLIRVEADEATYNLHIMLRFEIELALMEGDVDVSDLPELWNAKMEEYLQIVPPDDKEGVLQDIHWSAGYFGYFSTYSLGNLIGAIFWEKILEDLPDLQKQIEGADFAPLLSWLRENIHQHGAKYEPVELIQRVTGSGLTAEPYIRYLKKKFGEIYP